MATIQDFINQVNGKVINTDGADNGQCTAIPHLWEQLNSWPIVLGNAKDTYADAPGGFYSKALNNPNNYPLPGSIIVWGPTWGEGYGHTAVVVTANVNQFQCVEQNDGDNGLAHVANHNYSGVTGWFWPISLNVAAISGEVSPDFPKNVPIHQVVNVRTAPQVAAPVVSQLHIGYCTVTAITTGDSAAVGTHTSNQWYKTLGGHWFNAAATM